MSNINTYKFNNIIIQIYDTFSNNSVIPFIKNYTPYVIRIFFTIELEKMCDLN